MTGDEMRDQLAAALYAHGVLPSRCPVLADALMPVVCKIAADELRVVSGNVRHQAPGYVGRVDSADSIDDRADALDPS